MCKYHISPWQNRLRITVGMTTGEEWNESSHDASKVEQTKQESRSEFSTGRESLTSVDTQKQVSNHDMFCPRGGERACWSGCALQASTRWSDVCSSTTGRRGGVGAWRWTTGSCGRSWRGQRERIPWLGVPAEGQRSTAVTRQRGLATFSRQRSRFLINMCCHASLCQYDQKNTSSFHTFY